VIRRFRELEIAREARVKVRVNDHLVEVDCTPDMLRELGAGIALTKFGLNEVREVTVDGGEVRVTAKANTNRGRGHKTERSLKELESSLKLLDVKEYRKTRGYHIAVVVRDDVVARSYDVSRHAVLAKAIGCAVLGGEDVESCYVVFSGRLSKSVVEMCYNAGIPLIVSKAAIFDSAIDFCLKKGVSAVSFASGVVVGDSVKL